MLLEKIESRRALWAIVFASGLIGWAGCGKTAAPEPGDETFARKTLERALDSWRNGETIEAMKNASPPIIVQDRKWLKGDRLTRFEVEGAGIPWAAERKFHVKLWLKSGDKKEVQDACNYAVGTSPVLTVFRVVLE